VSSNAHGYRFFDEQGFEVLPKLGYLSFWQFLQTVAYENRVEVKGWDDPVVTLNDATLQLGTPASPMTGAEFYDSYLEAVFYQHLAVGVSDTYSYLMTPHANQTRQADRKTSAFHPVTLSLPWGASGVYGLVARLDPANPAIDRTRGAAGWDAAFAADVAQPAPDGSLTFTLPKGPLRLSGSFASEQPPGTAVLVKLGSGADDRGWFEVVAPEKVRVQQRTGTP